MTTLFPTDRHDDADWLAVRLVLGELSAGEAAAFEEQLAGDQAAREAVARATMLVAAAAAGPVAVEPVVVLVQRGMRKRAGLIAAVAAAVIVAVFASRPERGGPAGMTDPQRLVRLWSAAGPLPAEPADALAAPEPLAADSDAETGLPSPPDWLIAAVEYEAGGFEADAFGTGDFGTGDFGPAGGAGNGRAIERTN